MANEVSTQHMTPHIRHVRSAPKLAARPRHSHHVVERQKPRQRAECVCRGHAQYSHERQCWLRCFAHTTNLVPAGQSDAVGLQIWPMVVIRPHSRGPALPNSWYTTHASAVAVSQDPAARQTVAAGGHPWLMWSHTPHVGPALTMHAAGERLELDARTYLCAESERPRFTQRVQGRTSAEIVTGTGLPR